MSLFYVDASALVKRLVDEDESDAFEAHLADRLERGDVVVSSALISVELRSFAFRVGLEAKHVSTVLENVSQVAVSRHVLDNASEIQHHLRALDAIHLGTALLLGGDSDEVGVQQVRELVTYDRTMARVAAALGFETTMPGR